MKKTTKKDRLLTKKEAEELTAYFDKYMEQCVLQDEAAEEVLETTKTYYKKHKALVSKELKSNKINFLLSSVLLIILIIHFIAHLAELF